MSAQFGETYAQSVAKDQVLAALGDRTVIQALADGEDAKAPGARCATPSTCPSVYADPVEPPRHPRRARRPGAPGEPGKHHLGRAARRRTRVHAPVPQGPDQGDPARRLRGTSGRPGLVEAARGGRHGAALGPGRWTLPPVVLEAHFRPRNAYERGKIGARFRPVRSRCTAPARWPWPPAGTTSARGARHPVHVVEERPRTTLAEFDRPIGIGDVITVDTTAPVDVAAPGRHEVRSCLADCRLTLFDSSGVLST